MELIGYEQFNNLPFRKRNSKKTDYGELKRNILRLDSGDFLVVRREELFRNNVPFKKAYQNIYSFVSVFGKRNGIKLTTKTLEDGWVIERLN